MHHVAWGTGWNTKPAFILNWGADTGAWPSSARPAYRLYLGRYYRGERRGKAHIVITTTPDGGWILDRDFASDSWKEWRKDNGLVGLEGSNHMGMFQDTAEFKDASKKLARMLQRTEAARVATSQRLVSMSMLLHGRLRDVSAEDWERPSVGPHDAQRARAPTTANLKPGGRPTRPT